MHLYHHHIQDIWCNQSKISIVSNIPSIKSPHGMYIKIQNMLCNMNSPNIPNEYGNPITLNDMIIPISKYTKIHAMIIMMLHLLCFIGFIPILYYFICHLSSQILCQI